MTDSSDDDLPIDWIPYSNRKEWSDIKPLEQDDGPNSVVIISYSDKFKDVYNYFRAIVSKREKSLRALELTKDALKLNAANYTVWQYRRDIIKELNLSLLDELDYAEEVIIDNPKNYQVWHHRRVIVEWLNNPSKELILTEEILNLDAKNYHAWQHRQWAIRTFNLFDDELIYVDKLISDDVRNNSAWNQRFFVLKYTGFTTDVLQREIHYVINRIRFVKNNESTWNFLRGLLLEGDGTLDQFPEVVEFCEELYDNGVTSPYLITFLIDLYEEKYLRQITINNNEQQEQDETTNDDANNEQINLFDKVLKLCQIMEIQHDTIRQKYWHYVADSFKMKVMKIRKEKNCQKEDSIASTLTTATNDTNTTTGGDVEEIDEESESPV